MNNNSQSDQQLPERIAALEKAVSNLEDKIPVERVVGELRRMKRDMSLCLSTRVVSVPTNYYNLPLSERARLLSCSPKQLCKALLFEDTASAATSVSKFFLVIVQYVGINVYNVLMLNHIIRFITHILHASAKVSPDKLKDVVWRFQKSCSGNAQHAAPHLRVADEADSDRLTGFKHNAVSPFGLRTQFPVILAKACAGVTSSYIYLGAGSNS